MALTRIWQGKLRAILIELAFLALMFESISYHKRTKVNPKLSRITRTTTIKQRTRVMVNPHQELINYRSLLLRKMCILAP